MRQKLAIVILLLLAATTMVLFGISFLTEPNTNHPGLRGAKVIPNLWDCQWSSMGNEGYGRVQEITNTAWVCCIDGKITFGYQSEFYGPKQPKSWSIGVPGFFQIVASKNIGSPPRYKPSLWPTLEFWNVDVHLWWPILLFMVYPALAFIRGPYRLHRRRKKGLCLKCGYDLTGNVSGVCPECGERI